MAFDRVQGTPPFDLPIHLRQRVLALDYAQQPVQVRQRILQRPIEDGDLARNFLPPRAFVILGCDLEIALEQINDRQVSRCLPVRDRVGLQHQASALRDRLEFEQQPRLAHPWLPHRGYKLPVARLGSLGCVLEGLHLALASDELRIAPTG
jgi:hypothetical protein